jgi:BirA family transcriptional regulator, biotin operon repressor / biotin---[acetyl-CoA-carboxylase] ligase
LTERAFVVNISRAMAAEMKARILELLRGPDGCLSGQALGRSLGISRVSIWKHVHALKDEGYVIEASKRGYRLVSSPDLLLPYEFPGLAHRIHYFPEIGSTMDVARQLARQGADEGTVVIAESQSRGRGRLDREWISPRGGIYLTMILRPPIGPTYAPRISLMASLAVASTIRSLYGIEAGLKWPNDVLIAGGKVCGILAEMEADVDRVKFVNVGIGMNANAPVSHFETRATSLKAAVGRDISRKELLSALLLEIERQQSRLLEPELLEQWRRLSETLGKEVSIVTPGQVVAGQAIDIDDTGALLIRTVDGVLTKVVAGDCVHVLKR